MEILRFLRRKSVPKVFIPDLELPEYDNWLNFMDNGGTSEEWDILKSQNHWVFKESDTELFLRYNSEYRPIWDKYRIGMEKLQSEWSVIYNKKIYNRKRAERYEYDCIKNIQLYKQLIAIDKKYGEKSPPNVPAYKRLAMLYEKQGKYEKAVTVCTDALRNGACGDGMQGRLARMIKKADRIPNKDEKVLIENK